MGSLGTPVIAHDAEMFNRFKLGRTLDEAYAYYYFGTFGSIIE